MHSEENLDKKLNWAADFRAMKCSCASRWSFLSWSAGLTSEPGVKNRQDFHQMGME